MMKLNKIKKFILDLFFPKKCLGCEKHDTYLCAECFKKIEIIQNHTCFFCNKITGNGKICLNCQKNSGLDRIISATNYANPLIRNLIKALKYGLVQELAGPLSQLVIKNLENWILNTEHKDFIIIPIPLHSHRLRSRGFNQAELIAQKIASHFNLPIIPNALKRIKSTEKQAEQKNDISRKENVQNAFVMNPKIDFIPNKIVLLIDDVITSGATISEAAKILKQNNAKEVWAITIAKG